MSKKYKLVQDRDDDSIRSSVARHFIALVTIVAVIVGAMILVFGAFFFGAMRNAITDTNRPQAPSPTAVRMVTLQAYFGGANVVGYPSINAELSNYITYPVGQVCAFLDGPFHGKLSGAPTTFYFVRCDGRDVYVNDVSVKFR